MQMVIAIFIKARRKIKTQQLKAALECQAQKEGRLPFNVQELQNPERNVKE